VTLLLAHRILIGTFILFSVFLAGHLINRYGTTGSPADLACGIGSGVIAVGATIYLFKARHLQQK
jgi:hypothetical protein